MKKLFLILFFLSTLFLAGCLTRPTEFLLVFETNGGSEIRDYTVQINEPFVMPMNPIRRGHTFLGWYLDNNTFDEPLPSDFYMLNQTGQTLTVYAKWRINEYSIHFDTVGGTHVSPQTHTYNSLVSPPPEPLKYGHSFVRWHPSVPGRMPAEDILVTAEWLPNRYTISFNSDGGSRVSSITRFFNAAITPPTNPTKTGYTFQGWNPPLPSTMPGEDMQVTAIWIPNLYTIHFNSNGGTNVPNMMLSFGSFINLPPEPTKEGHHFIGWTPPLPNLMPSHDLTVTAQWGLNEYTIQFQSNGGTQVDDITRPFGTRVFEPTSPTRAGYDFGGWYKDPQFTERYLFNTMGAQNITLYALWVPSISMVTVGNHNVTYTLPTGLNDETTTTVSGGFSMATTQTTYELWYVVRRWAQAHGYHFENLGREGHNGVIGAAATSRSLEPVTNISWRDTIVWINALSELRGLEPVYRTIDGVPIRDARLSNASAFDTMIQTNHNGYRLPTSDEWDMAARWRNTGGNEGILVGGRYWTPGTFLSGAMGTTTADNRAVAWFSGASGGNITRAVGLLQANHLGLYDMSGNVWEHTITLVGSNVVSRGGAYDSVSSRVRIGEINTSGQGSAWRDRGFRLARGG